MSKNTEVCTTEDGKEFTKEDLIEAAERLERIEQNIRNLQEERRDIKKHLKNIGIDVKALSKALKELEFREKHPQVASITEFYIEKLEGNINI